MKTKNQLAKLLAEENIFVQHDPNAKTASFDVKQRVLTLPVWKNVSSSLIDMLIGHEVGHSLYTPENAWEQAIVKEGVSKNVLNIVEDPRIERKVQRKYPGLRACFVTGYRELFERGFFGELASGKRWDEMNLLDRLNIHFKGGASLCVPFFDEEQYLIRLVDQCETFDDAVRVSKEIMKHYAEEDEPETFPEEFFPGFEESDDNIGDGEEIEVPTDDLESAGEGFDKEEHEVDDEEVNTQAEYEARIEELRDAYAANRMYINLPKPNLNTLIINHDVVRKGMTDKLEQMYKASAEKIADMEEYEKDRYDGQFMPKLEPELRADYKSYRNASIKIVNYMVKEFERKKAAEEYKRTSINKTGVLNVNALHSYKYNDDLFLKRAIVHDGKNHGLLMLLDWSGSMHGQMFDTIKQVLNLVWFCSKVNIPFEVYAFTNQWYNEKVEQRDDESHEDYIRRKYPILWKQNHHDIAMDDTRGFRLLNLVSSRQSGQKQNESLYNLYQFGFTNQDYYNRTGWGKFDLGSTPLVEGLMVMNEILPAFKRDYKLDKVNLITLTDGEANSCWRKRVDEYTDSGFGYEHLTMGRTDIYYQDPITRKQYNITSPSYAKANMVRHYGHWAELQVQFLLKLMKDRYGINNIGIFLVQGKTVGRSILEKYLGWRSSYPAKHKKARKQIREEGFATVTTAGYDEYYVIPTMKNITSEGGLGEVDEDITKGKLKTLFMKHQKQKTGNRYLANRIMDLIV